MSALVGDFARALDPAAVSASVGVRLDPWQEQLVRATEDSLVNASRQSGKSFAAAILADHTALYRPGSLTLVLSSSERQGREVFRTCVAAYRTLDRPTAAESENALSLELTNASRIVVLPSTSGTIRGFAAVDLLILDEAARIEDETYLSVRPMLAVSGGRIVAMSTPYGRRGWWWEAWRSGSEAWRRFEVPASECPRISPAFLDEERRTLGDWWFRQEYGCEFMDAQSAAFREADVMAAIHPEVVAWDL